MALTVALAKSSPGSVFGNQTMNFTVTVTNTSSSSVTLNSLQVLEQTESDATLSQPNFLIPNTPVGVGNPTISASGSVTYGFQGVFNGPLPGPSPQAPGGAAGAPAAATPDANFAIGAMAVASDGSVGSGLLLVPVLSTIAPFPLANGGALQLGQGFNLINYLVVL